MGDGDLDWRTIRDFWFPAELETGGMEVVRRMEPWWMGGGAAPELPPFAPYVEAAAAGRLDHWAETPHGRLCLIIVLDQFPRGLFAGTPRAFAHDPQALALAEEGVRIGHYAAMRHPWERRFFTLPFVHAEGPDHLDRLHRLAAAIEAYLPTTAPEFRPMIEFGISQVRGNIDVISRFGRFPHRNEALGRESTPDERAYIEKGEFVHRRRPPYL